MSSLVIRPVELKQANAYIADYHRHHKPVQGHRFSIGVYMGDRLAGICCVGRPVARLAGHPLEVLEVTRLCTDGTKNACTKLLSAAAKAGRALGYRKIQTYTLPEEGGGSLRAAGWVFLGEAGGGQWKHTDGKPRRCDQPTGIKHKWERVLNSP